MTEIYDSRKQCIIKVRDIQQKINRTYNENGNKYNQKYVEFTVIGKVREYQDFILLKEFKKYNPDIKIKETP